MAESKTSSASASPPDSPSHEPNMPSYMEHIERRDLYESLPARISWLHSFLEFTSDDVEALISGQRYLKQIIPAIVNMVYKKLLKYDITARVFTTRDSRDEGPVSSWASEDSSTIQHRKMFLRWYLTKLNSDCTRMEYWEYLDKVGLMHVGKGRRNPLHVDYIFLGACLGFIQDCMFEAILSHPRLDLNRKIAIVKALGKVIWIQNDLIERWHNADGDEYAESSDDDESIEEANEKEGFLHGRKILGDDSSVRSSSTASSIRSNDSGKTSIGRPIEEATHLHNGVDITGMLPEGMTRCPFSGMAKPPADPAALDKQRAATTRSPALKNNSTELPRQLYSNPGPNPFTDPAEISKNIGKAL